jgi:hypothetical protein
MTEYWKSFFRFYYPILQRLIISSAALAGIASNLQKSGNLLTNRYWLFRCGARFAYRHSVALLLAPAEFGPGKRPPLNVSRYEPALALCASIRLLSLKSSTCLNKTTKPISQVWARVAQPQPYDATEASDSFAGHGQAESRLLICRSNSPNTLL